MQIETAMKWCITRAFEMTRKPSRHLHTHAQLLGTRNGAATLQKQPSASSKECVYSHHMVQLIDASSGETKTHIQTETFT